MLACWMCPHPISSAELAWVVNFAFCFWQGKFLSGNAEHMRTSSAERKTWVECKRFWKKLQFLFMCGACLTGIYSYFKKPNPFPDNGSNVRLSASSCALCSTFGFSAANPRLAPWGYLETSSGNRRGTSRAACLWIILRLTVIPGM
jgi:hypothetical protein